MVGISATAPARYCKTIASTATANPCIMATISQPVATEQEIIWREEVLPKATLRGLKFFATQSWLKQSSWYLAGGTALALHVGHRVSLDLDFFIPEKTFLPTELLKHFDEKTFITDIVKEGTVYGNIFGAKASFIAYPFFTPRAIPHFYGAVRVLPPADIAVMKIIAISQRGKKRDFFDLYWYAQNREPLLTVLNRLPDQYPTVAHDYHHILKSLTYFADAEEDPLPQICFKASWKQVKAYFQKEVPIITRKLLHMD